MSTAHTLTDAEKIALLQDALEAAQAHLEYCGWGDSWERECAEHAGLPEKIQAALDAVTPPAPEPCPRPLSARQLRAFRRGINDFRCGATKPPINWHDREAWLRGYEHALKGAAA